MILTAKELKDLSSGPFKLLNSRVRRSYTGGRLLEAWHGLTHPADGHQPEEWVASVVAARNGDEEPGEGWSYIRSRNGTEIALTELIGLDSRAFLGAAHVAAFGETPGLLTKVLDAAVRLSIQVHPSKTYARTMFNSAFGKTEAWYIMGGRDILGEAPYVLLGFKPGVTKAMWTSYFNAQNIPAMIDALHKIEVKTGDVFLIEGGVPHAIGSGCLLLEIQEPTDFTMRVERQMISGAPLPDFLCHQGLGFDRMLECFHYEAFSREQALERWKLKPTVITDAQGNRLTQAITYDHTLCFALQLIEIDQAFLLQAESFLVLLVLSGKGILKWNRRTEDLRQSDSYFLPAGSAPLTLLNPSAAPLKIALCYPPRHEN